MTAPDFNSTSVRADTVMGKTYTEAEVQALLAAKLEEAARIIDTWLQVTGKPDLASTIRALLAELETKA